MKTLTMLHEADISLQSKETYEDELKGGAWMVGILSFMVTGFMIWYHVWEPLYWLAYIIILPLIGFLVFRAKQHKNLAATQKAFRSALRDTMWKELFARYRIRSVIFYIRDMKTWHHEITNQSWKLAGCKVQIEDYTSYEYGLVINDDNVLQLLHLYKGTPPVETFQRETSAEKA